MRLAAPSGRFKSRPEMKIHYSNLFHFFCNVCVLIGTFELFNSGALRPGLSYPPHRDPRSAWYTRTSLISEL